MIMYINRYTVKPGAMNQLCEELAASNCEAMFRSEPGNNQFIFARSATEENVFYLVDAWEDETSFEAHKTCKAMPIWHAAKEKYIVEKVLNRYEI